MQCSCLAGPVLVIGTNGYWVKITNHDITALMMGFDHK